MFLSDYAIVDRLPGSKVAGAALGDAYGEKVLITVTELLLCDEAYTVQIIAKGFVTDRKALLISGREEGSILPCTEFLLPDVPEDIIDEIVEFGVVIFDLDSKVTLDFSTVEADLIDA